MPQGVTYDVNAFLRTQGSFQKEMGSSARAADQLGRSYGTMSDRLVAGGERVRGTFAGAARDMARAGVLAGAAGIAGGVALAAREGVKFNNQMEQGALGLGTMYTAFGVASDSMSVLSGETSDFSKSLELATAMQQELFDIAKKSPATFGDIALAYESMAPGVSGVTKDLMRQRDLMSRISVLGFTTGGDFKQLGTDIGRIVQGLAGADVRVFKTLEPVLRGVFSEYTGKEAGADFAKEFNQLDPTARLEVLEDALKKVPPEVNEAFGASFGGMAATIESQLQVIAGAFGKPLMTSMKKAMATVAGDSSPLDRLEVVASFAGQQLARAADYVFAKMIRGAEYVANNWMMIATKIQQAGVLAGAALKAASVVATARLIAGYGMIAVGKGATAAQSIAGGARAGGGAWSRMARRRHMGIGRGMAGEKGGGGLGMMGRGMSKVFGKLDRGGGFGILRGLDKVALSFATLAPMLAAASVAAGGLILVFSGVAVVVGGLAAYVVSSWDEIKASIVSAMEDGRITLVPLTVALYTLWERLKLVGHAIFGNITGASVMAGSLDLLTGAVDFASMTLGGMIRVVAFGIEVWAALKLGMAAVFQLIGDGLRVMAKIPGTGDKLDGAIAAVERMTQSTLGSAQDTFATARKFQDAAAAISNTTLDPMQLAAAEKKAKSLEQALEDMLSGKGKDEDGKDKNRKGKQTKVDVNVVINTNDPDVDRLMASFISWGERASDKRTQAHEGPADQGW